MRHLAKTIAPHTAQFILQCNIQQGIDREDEDQYRRASVEFAINLMKEAGFTSIDVTAPNGYSRPLVVAGKV